jgi:putative FmdB family regulatory protein
MPTYDYECRACGHAFEKFQSIKAPAVRKCPECGELKVARLIGAGAGIIFKGSGFYQTDYRSDSYKQAASKDKASSDGKGASDANASGTKSETKSDKSADSGDKKDSSSGPATKGDKK